jgi:hypothetical protein
MENEAGEFGGARRKRLKNWGSADMGAAMLPLKEREAKG